MPINRTCIPTRHQRSDLAAVQKIRACTITCTCYILRCIGSVRDCQRVPVTKTSFSNLRTKLSTQSLRFRIHDCPRVCTNTNSSKQIDHCIFTSPIRVRRDCQRVATKNPPRCCEFEQCIEHLIPNTWYLVPDIDRRYRTTARYCH